MPPSFVHALVGGALIGASASAMLLLQSRVAGISGIFATSLEPHEDSGWRWSFLGGLMLGGLALLALHPEAFGAGLGRSPAAVVAAGLLVGFGTRLGNGCTSGHGVCGLSRRSPRSLVAVAAFMTSGFVMASVVVRLLRGAA